MRVVRTSANAGRGVAMVLRCVSARDGRGVGGAMMLRPMMLRSMKRRSMMLRSMML
jgi:hypothetical protein